MIKLLFIILLLIHLNVNEIFGKFNRKKILINGRSLYGLRYLKNNNKNEFNNKKITRNSIENLFDQKINHFNSNDKNTFKQRFWYSNKWYVDGGPIFLMIGDSTSDSNEWIENEDSEWMKLAKENHAMVFLLEHRYYGASLPVKNMSTDNMILLSSRQAIEDVGYFIKSINQINNYSNNTKWIVFGGSYSGALAAWARQLHPELIYGAISSSGTIQAVVDFYQYLDVVKNSLSSYSSECANDLKKGLYEVRELLKTPSGQDKITKLFNLCDKWSTLSDDDKGYFWQSIFINYMEVVQYNLNNFGSYRDSLTIKNLCSYHLDNSSTSLEHLGNVYNWFEQQFGDFCTETSYEMYIDFLKEINFGEDYSDTRAWVWQTCTEFGFFQSTDNDAKNFWGNVIDINWYVKQCTDIFGDKLTNSTVYLGIHGTNTFYGGINNFKGTRVILLNGSIDPWHVLGILKKTNSQIYPILMNGTAHCADMYPEADDDLPSLINGRKQIKEILNNWLQ
ncbi:Peptidase S28 family-containing protein [Strongyloides ratti]|uniref:Peptidase S28 family-containing protein n=1 Tax=Strongyloides ratti TaxID=34506 RepID=A0A090L8N9_STRRB|nr:Peptidase S28 family-containing protein [Strongyloides ratti]CEF64503.1 Peptidase S28 family-containing protein [Strongyloides ratti]